MMPYLIFIGLVSVALWFVFRGPKHGNSRRYLTTNEQDSAKHEGQGKTYTSNDFQKLSWPLVRSHLKLFLFALVAFGFVSALKLLGVEFSD